MIPSRLGADVDHPSARGGDQAGLARAVGAAATADAELLSEVLDSLELDILVVDRRGVVIAWNRGFEARVAPRAAVLGRPVEEALARFTRAEWGVEWAARIRAEVLGGGRAVEIRRYPQRAPGGELLLFDVRADPIRDRGGAIHGAVLSMREVTDRARLEVETLRRETASELAHLGASVAHEIRNPLNSIGMNAQLLREELAAMAPGASLLETADLIVKEIRRLNGVVTTFLTYARHPALTSVPDDPNAAVRQAVRLLEAEARAVAVTLALDLGELPRIPLDRDQLAQGVYNLVLNGIQELAGGGVLTVTTRHERDYVLIEVTDTGRGIAPEDRERIFELFRTTREGGTGLGLPITRRIVEDHGGRITADNVPDGGGRFRIYLPVEAAGHRPAPAK